ncbi:MAG: hypothetical protein ACNI22_16480 [Halarcobacter sp.]
MEQKLVKKGNELFSDRKVISQYFPKDKKHMVNIAENAAQRIKLDAKRFRIKSRK